MWIDVRSKEKEKEKGKENKEASGAPAVFSSFMQIVDKDEKRVPTGAETQLILGISAVYKVLAV